MYHSVLFLRNRSFAVVAASAMAVSLWSGTATAQDVLKCQRTLVKEANKVEGKRAKGLSKCNDANLKAASKGEPTVVCPDPDNAAKIAASEAKMLTKVGDACTGVTLADLGFEDLVSRCTGGSNPNGLCAVAGDCLGGGTCDPVDECPDVFNGNLMTSCSDPLAGPSDVADCLICHGNNAVMGPLSIAHKHFVLPVPLNEANAKDVLKCQQTTGKNLAKYYTKYRKALAKCKDGVLKGDPGPCPDAAASTKITDALGKFQAKVDGACGAAGLFPNGVNRIDIFDWIVIPILPPFPIPPIDLFANYRTALASVADTLGQCSSELGTGDIATGCQPLCGNGSIDLGETCDDGNQLTGDSCPADCTIDNDCSPSGNVVATINVTPPAGISLAAAQVLVGYPDDKIRIPGLGNQASVLNRLTVTDPLAALSANDLNYGIRVLVNTSGDPITGGPSLATIDFDTCTGSPAPVDGDFTCVVQDTSDATAGGGAFGTTCAVDVP